MSDPLDLQGLPIYFTSHELVHNLRMWLDAMDPLRVNGDFGDVAQAMANEYGVTTEEILSQARTVICLMVLLQSLNKDKGA